MSTHDFCRCSLQTARQMAKEAGVKVPAGLSTWVDKSFEYAEVYAKGTTGQVWMGTACCAYEAKGNYILSLIPETRDF